MWFGERNVFTKYFRKEIPLLELRSPSLKADVAHLPNRAGPWIICSFSYFIQSRKSKMKTDKQIKISSSKNRIYQLSSFFFSFFLTWRSVISQPFAVFLQPWVQKKLLGRSLKCKYEQNAIVLNETVYRGVFLSAYGNILYPVMCITKCWASSHPCLWRTEPFRGYRSWCCHLLPVNLLTCWMFQTGYYRAFHNFPCLLLIPPQLAGIKFRINKYIYKS